MSARPLPRCRGAFPRSETDKLLLGVPLRPVGFRKVLGADTSDAFPALPLEGEGVVAAGSFPKECHVDDPIPAAHAKLP